MHGYHGSGYKLYSCSKCGKKDSATEGAPFCDSCEEDYRNVMEQARQERKRSVKCTIDCDMHHCRGCGTHYEASPGQRIGRCDECSM